ncbi:MAG TPA: hypothetical protein ENO20_12170 [Bacteroides sp.]|nr:hypothetical protein [Bacteroides sp.]
MTDPRRKILSAPARLTHLESMVSLSGQRTIFPFYHVVSDQHLPHIFHLYGYKNPAEFEKDLDAMLRIFEPLRLEDYLDGVAKNSRRRGMILSFDDGLAECHRVIAPLLKKKGVPAVFFLNNRFIDNRGLFFRYKTSILIDRVMSDPEMAGKAAEFLVIPEKQVVSALKMVDPPRQDLLDPLAAVLGVDFQNYLKNQPVYMTSEQIKDLRSWGFGIGGHGRDHADFSIMNRDEIIRQVRESVEDLRERFGVKTAWFSFPFSSAGVPGPVIRELLEANVAGALFGTAGIKNTGTMRFIQRIPMESVRGTAMEVLKTEYLYYLLKVPLGRNRLRY